MSIAIELHNTVYAAAGAVVDGLADPASLEARLEGLAQRLPDRGDRSAHLSANERYQDPAKKR